MRLSAAELAKIKITFSHFQSKDAELYLFGSRADSTKKGGDIDLLIIFKNSEQIFQFKKLDFLVALKKKLGERRIDVTVATEHEIETDEFLKVAFLGAVKI